MLGFDLGSDPACRTAIGQALATRRQAAVICPPLAGDETDHRLLYVLEPAWNEDTNPDKRPADQPEIDGFVVGVFRIGAVVETSLSVFVPVGIDIYITGPADGNAARRPSTRGSLRCTGKRGKWKRPTYRRRLPRVECT